MSSGLLGFLGEFFQGLIYPIRLFLKWCNWMGMVVFGFIWTIVKFTFAGLSALYTHIQGMASLYNETGSVISGQTPSAFSTIFTTVNTFVPLDLVLVYFSLLIQLWLFWNVYRLVKSWLPTLS